VSIYVRRAMLEDVDDIVAIARRFHRESPIHSRLSFNDGKVRHLITVALEDHDWLPCVAVDREGICGAALIFALPDFFSYDKVAGDFAFYVMPERRGSRASLLLLDHIMDWAERKGVKRLDIGIRTGINQDAAERFFVKRGMHRTGSLVSINLHD